MAPLHSLAKLIVLFITFTGVMLAPCDSVAQEETAESTVAATVNGVAITELQLQRELSVLVGKRVLTPEQTTLARTATLERLIRQRVVFEFLQTIESGASDEEVELQLESLVAELEQIEKTLDDHLEEINRSRQELEFQIAWQISWPRYLSTQLTDKNLEAHFRRHQSEFDGTTIRVAHLLLKTNPADPKDADPKDADPKDADPKDAVQRIQTNLDHAQEIAESISSSETTWGAAVLEFSNAPTRGSGGDIGWIGIDGPMPPSFTRAAFKLKRNEISLPVQTKFGIHLIQCLEIKPGKLGWRDAVERLKEDARIRLFTRIAVNHRPQVTIIKRP